MVRNTCTSVRSFWRSAVPSSHRDRFGRQNVQPQRPAPGPGEVLALAGPLFHGRYNLFVIVSETLGTAFWASGAP
jgi:hypothetical protein